MCKRYYAQMEHEYVYEQYLGAVIENNTQISPQWHIGEASNAIAANMLTHQQQHMPRNTHTPLEYILHQTCGTQIRTIRTSPHVLHDFN